MLNPEIIVRSFGLKNGDYVADFGSGHGYFIIPLARMVAPKGKIFAIDIQRSVLDVTRGKLKLENLLNAECIWSDLENPEGSKLKNDYVDFVLITNILHQAEKKDQLIKEAWRVLRSGGRMALIEWEAGKEKNTLGPPLSVRVSKKDAINLCTDRRFTLEKEFDAGAHHYGVMFVK